MREAAHFRRSFAVRAFVVGCAFSVLLAFAWREWLGMQVAREVDHDAANFESRVFARVEGYVAVLRGAAGWFQEDGWKNRTQFRRYFGPMDVSRNYPGVQGVGISVRLGPDEVDPLTARARREGWPDFLIWPAGARPEFHTILYLEPEDDRNLAALGYDMHTEEVRRAAMDHARDTGRAAVSGKVTLVQEIHRDKQPGFLIYYPFYSGEERPANEGDRRKRLAGYAYAPFRAGDFLQAIVDASPADAERLSVSLYDGVTADPATLIFQVEADRGEAAGPSVVRTRTLRVLDRPWTFVYRRDIRPIVSPWALAVVGFLISATVGVLLRRMEWASRRAQTSEEATLEREAQLALLVDAVPALVSYIDRHGVYRLCNRRYSELFGVDPDTLVGRHVSSVIGPQMYADIEPHLDQALAGETVSFERWYQLPGRGARYLGSMYVPHRTPKGELNGVYAVTADLTTHKRAEESARFIADCGKLLIASMDFESTTRGVVHLAVPRIADVAVLFRVSGDELRPVAAAHVRPEVEQSLAAFLSTLRMPSAAPNNIAAAARSGTVVVSPRVVSSELEGSVQDEGQRAVLRTLQLRSALHVPVIVRGQVWAVFSFGTSHESERQFTDEHRQLAEEISVRVRLAVENALLYGEAQQEIEVRRKAERAAREAEERYRLLVAGVRDYAIMALDAEGRIASWNDGAEGTLGYGETEAIGADTAQLHTKHDQAAGAAATQLARARERGAASEERWFVRKDGSVFWASSHTVALRDEDGVLTGYAWILRDLTDRKRMEEELERRVEARTTELNDAIHELESFSYSVSHDLRAPLRTIRGFTEMALEEAGERLNDAERGYLERVRRAASRLDRLIADLLAYTRVSKTKVELRPVPLQTLVSDIQREHPEFQQPSADVEIAGPLQAAIGNEAYLTQCVTNLLGNAVKFVREGQVAKVRVWTERRGDMVRLYVSDNGIGIAPEHLGRAFEIFERLHTGGGYEGTGVGLAIVRRAVQRMHGTVGVESKLGEGTTFWIELPAADPT